jgi:hypothetical protein
VGLDVVSIGIGSLLGFSPGWTSIAELLFLSSTFINFTQQRLRADGILIPNLHKALPVGRHASEIDKL